MVCGASVWYMQHCGIFLIVRAFSLFRRLAAEAAASVSESASASSSSSSARCPGGPGGEPPSVIEDLRAQRRVHQHPAHIPRITHSRDQAPRAKRSMPLQASLAPWLSRLSKFLLSQNGLRPVNVFKDPWNPRLAATRVPKGQGPRAKGHLERPLWHSLVWASSLDGQVGLALGLGGIDRLAGGTT